MTEAANPLLGNRYRLLRPLGKGGMGEVWSAFDRFTRQTVAVKRLALSQFARLSSSSGVSPSTQAAAKTDAGVQQDADTLEGETLAASTPVTPHLSPLEPNPSSSGDSSQKLRRALAQEFRVLASLRHPSIISVLDYGFDEQRQPFLAMELLEVPLDLGEAARGLPPARRVALLIQVLQALVYLHRRGILHRDLKPQNVLVHDGAVKVLDFGLATKRPETEELAGTIRYMAPEILQGKSASVGSDLYSVGVMAYELLVGKYPLTHSSAPRDFIRVHFDLEPLLKLQQEILPGAPIGLDGIIRRLLSPQHSKRYSRAVDVIGDFSAAVGELVPRETTAIRESFLQAAEFVGRYHEISGFRKRLNRLEEGKGAAVLVGGESGVGKSRLIEEIRTEALVAGALVVRGQAVAEAGLPYQEWREPVRRLCLNAEWSDEELACLGTFVPDLAELLERPVPPLQRPDPGSLRQRLSAAVTALFQRQSDPVLLILEDIHWTSEDSLFLLRQICQLADSHPLMIVGTFRDDERPQLRAELPQMEPIKLSRLSDAAIAELSESILGERGVQPEVVEYLKKETEGNVFFLVEVVRSLAESAGGLDQIISENIPERLTTHGISEIVRRRLNRIPAEWWPSTELAAVVGRQIDVAVLAAALPETSAQEWLRVAADCAVVDLNEGKWRFAHDKLREAVLASMEEAKIAEWHQRAALSLEAVYPEAARPAPRLAYHWGRAGHPEREQPYAAIAGAEMLRGAAYAGAITYLERAVELLPFVPEEQGRARQELGLQLNLGTAYLITRGHASAEMKRAFDRADQLCVQLGDTEQLFRVLFGQATFYLFSGNLNAALELAERCLHHARQSGNAETLLEAHFALGNVHYWRGNFSGALTEAQQVIASYQPYEHDLHVARYGHNPRITCATYAAWSTWALGFPDQAARMAHEALHMAEEHNHPFSRAIAVQTLAFLYHQRRDIEQTRHYAESLIDNAGDYPTYWVAGRFLLGWTLIRSNQVEEGVKIIRQAWSRWREAGAGVAHSLYATFLLEAALETGEFAEGLALADSALRSAQAAGERSHEAELLRLRGELFWKLAGKPERAEAEFGVAIQVAKSQQARSYELRALVSLGALLREQGKAALAREKLSPVYSSFTEGFETEDLQAAANFWR